MIKWLTWGHLRAIRKGFFHLKKLPWSIIVVQYHPSSVFALHIETPEFKCFCEDRWAAKAVFDFWILMSFLARNTVSVEWTRDGSVSLGVKDHQSQHAAGPFSRLLSYRANRIIRWSLRGTHSEAFSEPKGWYLNSPGYHASLRAWPDSALTLHLCTTATSFSGLQPMDPSAAPRPFSPPFLCPAGSCSFRT